MRNVYYDLYVINIYDLHLLYKYIYIFLLLKEHIKKICFKTYLD